MRDWKGGVEFGRLVGGMGTVAEMVSTRMVRFKPGEKQVMALRDALFSDTGRDKDVRLRASLDMSYL